jgi:hypothetical protein
MEDKPLSSAEWYKALTMLGQLTIDSSDCDSLLVSHWSIPPVKHNDV